MAILYKKIEPEDVLKMMIHLVGQNLPKEILESEDAEIIATFNDDHSIEFHVVNIGEEIDSEEKEETDKSSLN